MAAIQAIFVLALYGYGDYLVCSRQTPQELSPERIMVCVVTYVVGTVLMNGSDGQKYFTLREKKKLLNDGFMKWSRNPNYLGEVLIYSSFALIPQRNEPWIVNGFMWATVFAAGMAQKDYSLSKKLGWDEYKSHSWILFFKFGGSAVLSLLIYGVSFGILIFCLQSGGIEKAVKRLIM